jgi:hypothetical protein
MSRNWPDLARLILMTVEHNLAYLPLCELSPEVRGRAMLSADMQHDADLQFRGVLLIAWVRNGSPPAPCSDECFGILAQSSACLAYDGRAQCEPICGILVSKSSVNLRWESNCVLPSRISGNRPTGVHRKLASPAR